MSPPSPTAARPSRRAGRRNARPWRAAALVTAVALGPLAGAGPTVGASASVTSEGRDVGSAERTLASATASRIAAERRRDELAAELAAVTGELDRQSAGAAEVAQDLEAARRSMRAGAIAAYIASGTDPSLAVLTGDDLSDLSAERTFAQRHTLDWADAAVRFRELKEQNDPALVALAERRAAVAARLDDAIDAALQASAVESEAERSASDARRRAAEAQAKAAADAEAAAQARTRAAAASAAAARPSGGAPTTGSRPVAPAPAPVVPHDEPSAPLPELPPFGPSPEAWAEVRRCESGGNYRAVSRSGRYRGAYQFDTQTWESVGGLGDPAAAPPVEQDARAALLFARRGARAWPVCGRALVGG